MNNDKEYRINLVDYFQMDLNQMIDDGKNKKHLERIIKYMNAYKSTCMDYLYTSNKYKESVICLTHIYSTILRDFTKDVSNMADKYYN